MSLLLHWALKVFTAARGAKLVVGVVVYRMYDGNCMLDIASRYIYHTGASTPGHTTRPALFMCYCYLWLGDHAQQPDLLVARAAGFPRERVESSLTGRASCHMEKVPQTHDGEQLKQFEYSEQRKPEE